MANELDLDLKLESTSKENNIALNDIKIEMRKLKELNNLIKIENTQAIVDYPAKDIIKKLINDLFEYDTNFLKHYYDVLQSNNTATIKEVTDNILSSIQQALLQKTSTEKPLNEWETVTLAAWLSAAALWTEPRVPEAPRTFQTLLASMGEHEMKRIAEMWWRSVPVDALLELEAVAHAPPAPRALADMLLRAALHELAPLGPAPRWAAGAPAAAELEEAAFRAGVSAPLLRVAARVPATDRNMSLLACLARQSRTCVASGRCERLQISVSVSKLHMLFGDGGTRTTNRGRKRKSSTVSQERPGKRKDGKSTPRRASGSVSAAPSSGRSYDARHSHLPQAER